MTFRSIVEISYSPKEQRLTALLYCAEIFPRTLDIQICWLADVPKGKNLIFYFSNDR
jgi:hypothetical protein